MYHYIIQVSSKPIPAFKVLNWQLRMQQTSVTYLAMVTRKVNPARDWTESEASLVIGHVISMLTTQTSNRGFIWHANSSMIQFTCHMTTRRHKDR